MSQNPRAAAAVVYRKCWRLPQWTSQIEASAIAIPVGSRFAVERLGDAGLDRVVDRVALLRRLGQPADVAARVDVRARGPQEQAPAVDLDVARRLARVVGLLLAVAEVAHRRRSGTARCRRTSCTGRRRRSGRSRAPAFARSQWPVRASAATAYVRVAHPAGVPAAGRQAREDHAGVLVARRVGRTAPGSAPCAAPSRPGARSRSRSATAPARGGLPPRLVLREDAAAAACRRSACRRERGPRRARGGRAAVGVEQHRDAPPRGLRPARSCRGSSRTHC